MNKRQKEVIQHQLTIEKAVLDSLEKEYRAALKDINLKIKMLQSDELTQSRIYHIQYQKTLKKQVEAAIEKLHSDEYSTIQQYLSESYTDSFVGTMYDVHGQGVPVIAPIDQNAAIKAVLTDSKLSKPLYDTLGVDVNKLKKNISQEISRGIASGLMYNEIARNIEFFTNAPLSRAKTIVRTEAHRIQEASTEDARQLAKSKGADVVKQWDATLDGDTRPTHRELDGQIRELDEYFEANGKKAKYPGEFGDPAEDCNCRCAALTRARWALDEDELETLKERAEFFDLDKADSFKDFKKKYLKAAQTVENTGKSGIIEADKSATLQTPISQAYVDALNSGGKVSTIGNVDCAVMEKDYGFNDGTSGGIKKTVKATVYTTPDGTQFVYPKSYDKKKQTLSPDDAIATWYRVPENIRQKIQKVVEIVDYYNPQDAIWRKRYKSFTHSYATGGDKITLWRSSYHDLNYLAETYCHEGGHYIDYTLPGTDEVNRYCNQPDWQAAMASDLKTSGKKSWRAYGENSPLEDFADSVAYYTFEHAQFVASFPERSKLLDSILK